MTKKLIIITISILFTSAAFSQHFHKQYNSKISNLITDPTNLYNDYFAGAGACIQCHNSQVDEQGHSVAILNDWRSTMMANAARDPFWQAKVSHEVLVNPNLKNEIETVCSRCHAPMGNINAMYNGQEFYTLQQMNSDPLAMDGASCTVCHQITPESMGNSSGNFIIEDTKKIYGPYTAPFANPMINNTGFTPVHSEHIKDSRLCESCHTLITHPVDLNGGHTGGEFVEQSPFQEWQNSVYSQDNTSCAECHIPEIEDVVKISSLPPFLDGRTPFGKHHFAGANVFMLKLLKSNIDLLNITADEIQFDSSINRTYENLQLKTLDLNINEQNRTPDTLFIDLELNNLAGHKLPTAYPSRRIFIELFAINNTGDTIFHSGKYNSDFNLIEEDVDFETHHNTINNNNQVQIYEMVMGDVNGDYTTVLERAAIHLKDNRIPPVGFKTSHFSYDTTQIVGNALTDPDFNNTNETEGTGADIIHFNIPLSNNNTDIIVKANVFYQTVSNRWLENMFTYSSEAINLFKSMYNEADKSPVLLANKELLSNAVSLQIKIFPSINIYPNPSKGNVFLSCDEEIISVDIFSLNGKLINAMDKNTSGNYSMNFFVTNEKGIYFVVVNTAKNRIIKKIVIN
jgi:hypothetical protein